MLSDQGPISLGCHLTLCPCPRGAEFGTNALGKNPFPLRPHANPSLEPNTLFVCQGWGLGVGQKGLAEVSTSQGWAPPPNMPTALPSPAHQPNPTPCLLLPAFSLQTHWPLLSPYCWRVSAHHRAFAHPALVSKALFPLFGTVLYRLLT